MEGVVVSSKSCREKNTIRGLTSLLSLVSRTATPASTLPTVNEISIVDCEYGLVLRKMDLLSTRTKFPETESCDADS